MNDTTNNYMYCETDHLTPFSAGLFVPPNSLDFEFVFLNGSFENNLSIWISLLFIFLMYILMMLWSNYKDKQDLLKIRSLPLDDNDPQVTHITVTYNVQGIYDVWDSKKKGLYTILN